MTLEKLIIKHETMKPLSFDGKITALFNPTQLSYSQSIGWMRTSSAKPVTGVPLGRLEYRPGEPETFTIDLFFDTYEGDPAASFGTLSVPTRPASVLPYTKQVTALAAVNRELHRPPACQLQWGKTLLFAGVLRDLKRDFLLFLDDGTPVRATMKCTFVDFQANPGTATENHSSDVAKKYTVRPGDTLTWIAAQLYGDQSQWRRIAEANEIDDPRNLKPGRVLAIPKIG